MDLRLPLCATVRGAMRCIVGCVGPLVRAFEARTRDDPSPGPRALRGQGPGGADAAPTAAPMPPVEAVHAAGGLDAAECTLYELSTFHSLPGAPEQPMHSDTVERRERFLTVFCALHDIDVSMGPTVLWPGSHMRVHLHDRMSAQQRAEGCERTPGVLRKGEALVMDSRLVHCGGANRSASDRVLFYHSWCLPGVTADQGNGATTSMLPEYQDKMTFGDWEVWTGPDQPPPPSVGEVLLAPGGEYDGGRRQAPTSES